eukprot:333051_1
MSGAKIRNTATQFNRISSIQTGCTQYKGINNIKKERGYYKNQIKTYIQSNPHLMVDEIWKWFNKAEYKKWNKVNACKNIKQYRQEVWKSLFKKTTNNKVDATNSPKPNQKNDASTVTTKLEN